MVYNYDNTERHHCLMGEKIYTFGDRQASIVESVFLLICSKKFKTRLCCDAMKGTLRRENQN